MLAVTEIWERFSFYGVRALLVLYLTSGALDHDRFKDVAGARVVYFFFGRPANEAEVYALASAINEWYSGMAFVTPLFGGWMADRWLGIQNTCILGGLMMTAAHFCMAFDYFFLIGLSLLVLGNGAFKPTISAQLSHLYDDPELAPLREGAFALYYMAINFGALLAPLACGYLQEYVSFHAGFGAAGVGMVFGLIVYVSQLHHLPKEKGHLPKNGGFSKAHASDTDFSKPHASDVDLKQVTAHRRDATSKEVQIRDAFDPKYGPGSPLERGEAPSDHIWKRGEAPSDHWDQTRPIFGSNAPYLGSKAPSDHWDDPQCKLPPGMEKLPPGTLSKDPKGKRGSQEIQWPADGRWPLRRMLALSAICALVLPYWVCWEQMANMVPLYYETSVERTVLGRTMPAAALQCISPIFTIIFLPFFSARWARQAKSGTEQSTAVKLTIGAAFDSLGWLVFALTADPTRVSDPLHGKYKCSLLWPIFGNLLYTIGHIHVGPVGLSLVTRCAPPGSQSLAVGLWFLFGGFSGPVAGWFGALYALWTPAWFFGGLAAIAMANAAVLLALTNCLERIARGHEAF